MNPIHAELLIVSSSSAMSCTSPCAPRNSWRSRSFSADNSSRVRVCRSTFPGKRQRSKEAVKNQPICFEDVITTVVCTGGQIRVYECARAPNRNKVSAGEPAEGPLARIIVHSSEIPIYQVAPPLASGWRSPDLVPAPRHGDRAIRTTKSARGALA